MAKFMKFEEAIEAYLKKLADTDELFAKTFAKKNKNLRGCCNYIMSEAQKAAKGGRCVALSDAEVYNLAVHYYDEDDIKAPDNVVGEVVVAAPKAEQPNEPKYAKRKKTAKTEPQPEPKIEVAAEVEEEESYELDIPVF